MDSRLRFAASVALVLVAASLALSAPARAACTGPLFLKPASLPSGPSPTIPAVADFDGDGIADLAVANHANGTVTVYRGTAGGPVRDTSYNTAAGPRGLIVADFNHDGIPDLAVASEGARDVTILLGLGNGRFGIGHAFLTGSTQNRDLAAADFNGDGVLDLAVASQNCVSVLIGAGDGTFAAPVDYPTPSSWSVAVGDFDHDGILDIAAGNWLTPSLSLLLGRGDGTFAAGDPVPLPGGCAFLRAARLDGDAYDDLAIAGSTGLVTLTGTAAGGFVAHALSAPALVGLALLDVDRDGFLDVAAVQAGAAAVSIFRGVGDGTFVSSEGWLVGAGPGGVAAGDLDGDGGIDLAVTGELDNTVTVLMGTCVPPGPPVVRSFAPAFAFAGDTVAVTGERFTGATGVRFASLAAAWFRVVDDRHLRAVVPPSAADGSIAVTTSLGTGASLTAFVVAHLPEIGAAQPDSGAVGDTIRVRGRHLATTWRVEFGDPYGQPHGHDPVFFVDSDSLLRAVVNGYSDIGPIYLFNAYGSAASAFVFTVVVPPPPGSEGTAGGPPWAHSPVVGGDVAVSFAPPAGRSTRVALVDVSGRVVAEREVPAGGGRRTLALARAAELPPGLYLVRVALDPPVTLRVVVIR